MKILFSTIQLLTLRILCFALLFVYAALLLSLAPCPTFAQKNRPKIIVSKRTEYAGRLLLLPRDSRPVSWKFPRMIARLADYDVIVPPRELLGEGAAKINIEGVLAWVKTQDFAQINGVIIGLDAMLDNSAEPKNRKEQLDIINWMRAQKPNLAIYGFAQKTTPELSAYEFDDLQIDDDPDLAPLLIARFLNRNYERPPKVFPITAAEYSPRLLQALQKKITATGAQMVTSGKADLFLFILPPNTDETKRANFADALAQTLTSGYYVALADLSGKPEELLTILRTRKQLDLLQSYSASTSPEIAFGTTLAQVSTRLLAAKVLRASLGEEQLRRAERAQVELLLSRYLEDWGYQINIRPRLEKHIREQLQAEPQKLGTATERTETFLQNEMQTVANELFNQQFKYNVHSVRVPNGYRIDFQVVILQRCQARLPLQRTDEIELEIGIHLPTLVGLDGSPLRR